MADAMAHRGRHPDDTLTRIDASYLSWPWIFLVNVPVGVGAIALTPLLLGESRAVLPHRHFDLAGCRTSFAFPRPDGRRPCRLGARRRCRIRRCPGCRRPRRRPSRADDWAPRSCLSAAQLSRVPLEGHFFWDLFPAFLLGGAGLGVSFVSATIGSLTGVRPSDSGSHPVSSTRAARLAVPSVSPQSARSPPHHQLIRRLAPRGTGIGRPRSHSRPSDRPLHSHRPSPVRRADRRDPGQASTAFLRGRACTRPATRSAPRDSVTSVRQEKLGSVSNCSS
jgi:hypothetical protein